MLDRISLIRNIGQFDSVSDGANLPLSRLTLVYAENGRGKTTLSAILRSLGTGDPVPISERKRLSATQPPHVVVKPITGSAMNFQGGAWTQTISNLAVFDDVFVDQNVYSGCRSKPRIVKTFTSLSLAPKASLWAKRSRTSWIATKSTTRRYD